MACGNRSWLVEAKLTVIVEVPKLAVVALVRPPKRIVAQVLVLLKVSPHTPPLVVRQRVSVLLEQRVDTRDTAVPRVLEILERQPTVLRLRLLTLERVLGPHLAFGKDVLAYGVL
jgi:hypothetical protein